MRQPVIAGNWKMNCTRPEAASLVSGLLPLIGGATAEIVLCPPFTALALVEELLRDTPVALGGQDLFWKEKGAYTGQIAPSMLTEIRCKYVIVGHSERRGRFGVPEPEFNADVLRYFGDNDETVNRKLRAALAGGLIPICCVGETLAERQSAQTDTIIANQTAAALRGVSADDAVRSIFAYEPVWAIGTGEVCASVEADRVCGVIRKQVMRLYSTSVADAVRIQYGGSVKPDNAEEILAKPNIDGALVGGASLKAAEFAAIVNAAR